MYEFYSVFTGLVVSFAMIWLIWLKPWLEERSLEPVAGDQATKAPISLRRNKLFAVSVVGFLPDGNHVFSAGYEVAQTRELAMGQAVLSYEQRNPEAADVDVMSLEIPPKVWAGKSA